MRNTQVAQADLYIKRFVYELPNRGLTFNVVKCTQDREQLMLKTFFERQPQREAESSERFSVQVMLDIEGTRPEGPLLGWSLARRIFEIASDDPSSAIVIKGQLGLLEQGANCVIVLGEDLPPGAYRIRLKRNDSLSSPAFVSLCQIQPPADSKRESRIDQWTERTKPHLLRVPSRAIAGRRGNGVHGTKRDRRFGSNRRE